jgi:hypothetical protein
MITKTTKALVIVLVGAFGVAWFFYEPDVHTRLFCAYDRVFVEFDDGKSVWGTMFLDDKGRPIPCKDDYILDMTESSTQTTI